MINITSTNLNIQINSNKLINLNNKRNIFYPDKSVFNEKALILKSDKDEYFLILDAIIIINVSKITIYSQFDISKLEKNNDSKKRKKYKNNFIKFKRLFNYYTNKYDFGLKPKELNYLRKSVVYMNKYNALIKGKFIIKGEN
ncbi:MAG: hypothetical protein K4H23_02505 [Mollicutes bacterium PWAP]|nr:hypothetical protein [Mollicutes bacterium PWAP]